MIRVKLCVFVTLICFANSMKSSLEPFYRNDYTYEGRQEAFYKLHTTPRRFADAMFTCLAEGSQLAYPRSEAEATILVTLMKENLPESVQEMWVGGHDRFAEGVYQTLDGEDIDTLYANWDEGEPNDYKYNQDCLVIDRDAKLNDKRCGSMRPAICKKLRSSTVKVNQICETFDTAYVPDLECGRCYKVHMEERNWSRAYAVCHAEQAYLVEINSEKEADFLRNLLNDCSDEKFKGNSSKQWFAVGFNDMFLEGEYVTYHGKTLEAAGYANWKPGQPDNYRGRENCGSVDRNIRLNDIDCDKRMSFVCEKEIGDPNMVDVFERFGETGSDVAQ